MWNLKYVLVFNNFNNIVTPFTSLTLNTLIYNIFSLSFVRFLINSKTLFSSLISTSFFNLSSLILTFNLTLLILSFIATQFRLILFTKLFIVGLKVFRIFDILILIPKSVSYSI